MSWAVGFDENWQRDIGYGVPAMCDHPDCNEKIDRGLSFVCGGDLFGGEHGCGLFFCSSHLFYERDKSLPQRCNRCISHAEPYNPKPDRPEWINHKATDPSWAQWRKEQEAIAL